MPRFVPDPEKTPEQNEAARRRHEARTSGMSAIEIAARESYGFMASFLDHPEIGPLLRKAAENGWSRETLQGEVYKTKWWKRTSAVTREWQQLKSTDPASARARRDEKERQIRRMLSVQGVRLPSRDIMQLAEWSLATGMDDASLQEAVFQNVSWKGKVPKGQMGGQMTAIKARGADYFLNVSDKAAFNWARRIAAGIQNEAAFDTWARKQAMSRFGHFRDELDSGLTMADVADSYIQQTSQLLEMDPEDLDMRDRRWIKMLDHVDEDGRRRAMTLSEAATYARKTDRYKQTRQAKQQASEMGETLLRTFGKVGA